MSELFSKRKIYDEGNPSSNLWILGEAGGEEEDRKQQPFVGRAGDLLNESLSIIGVQRHECFITNVFPHRPKDNNFSLILDTIELKDNLVRLSDLHKQHKPNVIMCLGENVINQLIQFYGIGVFRGSILEYQGSKAIPTYHPAAILREDSLYPIFMRDVRFIARESRYPEFNYPVYNYIIDPQDDSFVELLASKEYISCDIENTKKDKRILCVGFGFDDTGITYPWIPKNIPKIEYILKSKAKKIFHSGSHDVNTLTWQGFPINNYCEDTISQAHILQPELPRDLNYLSSIYTRLPSYKKLGRQTIPDDEKSWGANRTPEELHIYNAKDCVVTYKVWEAQNKELKERNLESFYRSEMDMAIASIELSQTGLLRDQDRVEFLIKGINKTRLEKYTFLFQLTKLKFKVRSNKDVPYVLYEHLKLPKRKQRKTKKNQEPGLTTDEDAIVSLIGFCKNKIAEYSTESKIMEWKIKLGVLKLILELRGIEKLLSSYLKCPSSNDGVVRSVFKVFSTDTGRLSASKFVDGTGMNLQTPPRDLMEIEHE